MTITEQLKKLIDRATLNRGPLRKDELILLSDIFRKLNEGRSGIIGEIEAERKRQVEEEGWTAKHDDEHARDGAMAYAAAAYAFVEIPTSTVKESMALWSFTGFAVHWFKPKGRRRNLIRAGALIVAEIERLDRRAKN